MRYIELKAKDLRIVPLAALHDAFCDKIMPGEGAAKVLLGAWDGVVDSNSCSDDYQEFDLLTLYEAMDQVVARGGLRIGVVLAVFLHDANNEVLYSATVTLARNGFWVEHVDDMRCEEFVPDPVHDVMEEQRRIERWQASKPVSVLPSRTYDIDEKGHTWALRWVQVPATHLNQP